MTATENFKMRISPQDKAMLASVAKHLQRSQSDTVKTIVREVYLVITAADRAGEVRSASQEQTAA